MHFLNFTLFALLSRTRVLCDSFQIEKVILFKNKLAVPNIDIDIVDQVCKKLDRPILTCLFKIPEGKKRRMKHVNVAICWNAYSNIGAPMYG